MSSFIKKINFIKLLIVLGITTFILSSAGFTYARNGGQGNGVEKVALDKLTTLTTQLSAQGGTLNVVKIEKGEGEGPIKLDKAFLFVKDGLNAGNVHFHNLKVDGITLAHFDMGELNYVTAPETENDPKIRGAEVTHLIKEFMNCGNLEIIANESIEFDFMAAMPNDPSPTPVSLMIHVKSLQGANVSIGLQE